MKYGTRSIVAATIAIVSLTGGCTQKPQGLVSSSGAAIAGSAGNVVTVNEKVLKLTSRIFEDRTFYVSVTPSTLGTEAEPLPLDRYDSWPILIADLKPVTLGKEQSFSGDTDISDAIDAVEAAFRERMLCTRAGSARRSYEIAPAMRDAMRRDVQYSSKANALVFRGRCQNDFPEFIIP